jgi:trans-aconitate methyltransferase
MTELTIFEKIAQHPQRAQRYAEAMSWFNTGPGLEPVHVLDNYPWESSRTGTVVDVGGGYGSVSIALAQRFSSIQCIVQDRAEVVREARIKLPVHLADRVSFIEHDFFEDQPVMNADVFFLRWILHDWSDTYAIRILRSLIPALKPGTRVLVNEHILPEPGAVPLYREKMLR